MLRRRAVRARAGHAEAPDLATVFVVAPSSTDEQLAETVAAGTGFGYTSALMGVTGARSSVDALAAGRARTAHGRGAQPNHFKARRRP
ncbi:tryptophan synthase subunit alpha [Amycolatopsis bartoniae]|uniref:tryptophan synthase subunit alpha n=1 Tax=Amycolatopsis bartoniae TaxID=941986 RepID=UPI003570E270